MQLAVKSGAIQVPPGFDWTGFYGHLYLWTPHFLVWGALLAVTALSYTRSTSRQSRDVVALAAQPGGRHLSTEAGLHGPEGHELPGRTLGRYRGGH